MGYTHYWRLKQTRKTIPQPALDIIKEIVEDECAGYLQRGMHNTHPPLVTQTEVLFNGCSGQDYETFHFSIRQKGFACCKTAERPYDKAVMAVLIVLQHYLGDDLKVTSDGLFDEEWLAMRLYVEKRWGCHLYDVSFFTNPDKSTKKLMDIEWVSLPSRSD